MDNQTPHIPPVLETAWNCFADYDNTAKQLGKKYFFLRRLVFYFSLLAIFLAILIGNHRNTFTGISPALAIFFQVILIILPIAGSIITANSSKYIRGQKFQILRMGANEILKEIYLYRTVMQSYPQRNKWLNSQLTEIQRLVYQSSGGEVTVKPYQGNQINPYFDPNASYPSDEGINDLNSDEYMRLRIEDQLVWYIRMIESHEKRNKRLVSLILLMGVIGSMLASIDFFANGLAIWVSLAVAISIMITNWKDLSGLESTTANYRNVIQKLSEIRDDWLNSEQNDQTQSNFFAMVQNTERLLGSQNTQNISSFPPYLAKVEIEQHIIVQEIITLSDEVVGKVQVQILEDANHSMKTKSKATTANGYELDNERLPAGARLNTVLGPVEALNIDKDMDDAPDGFEQSEM